MKKILLVLSVLFASFFFNNLLAQNNDAKSGKCKIVTLGSSYSSEQILKAVDAADWCGYFHKTKNYTLKFDDGSVVELLSYTELAPKGISINGACVQDEATSDNSTYSILPSGNIGKQVPKNTHVKSFNKK